MAEAELIRSYPYKIRTYQVGGTGKISLHHLFSLFQDVAHRDATRFGFAYHQMLAHDRLWVLSRMSLEIDELPSYDDEVVIQTWVKSVSGPKSEREFTLIFNDRRVVKASSLWFCLSTEDHRPARIPLEKQLYDLVNDEYAMGRGAEKINLDKTSQVGKGPNSFKAKPSDVDMVNHVNNASYVRWVMDDLSSEKPNLEVSSFDINYLNEVKLADEVGVIEYPELDGSVFHEIIKLSSQEIVCRTKTVWKNA